MDPPESTDPVPRGTRLTGSEAVRLHLTLALALALCIGAFWFEVRRALGGNELSWAYVFEWPFFAGYAVYMWWRLLHEVPLAAAERGAAPARHTPDESSGRRATRPPGSGSPAGGTYPDSDVPDHVSDDHVSDSDVPDHVPDPDEADRAAYNQYLSELATRGKRKQWR